MRQRRVQRPVPVDAVMDLRPADRSPFLAIGKRLGEKAHNCLITLFSTW